MTTSGVYILKEKRRSHHWIHHEKGVGYFIDYDEETRLVLTRNLVSLIESGEVNGISFYCLKRYRPKNSRKAQ